MHIVPGTCPSRSVLTAGASQVIKPDASGVLPQGTAYSYWFVCIDAPLLSVLGYSSLFLSPKILSPPPNW